MFCPLIVRRAALLFLLCMALMPSSLWADPETGDFAGHPAVQQQIEAILQEKASRTPAQQKLDSNLLYQSRIQVGANVAAGIHTLQTGIAVLPGAKVEVDIEADVTDTLLSRITAAGGSVVSSFPEYHAVRAILPLRQLETLAGLPEVRFIKPAVGGAVWKSLPETAPGPLVPRASAAVAPRHGQAATFAARAADVRSDLPGLLREAASQKLAPATIIRDTGNTDSEGDTTERVQLGRSKYHVDGTGIRIGVLSDSDRYLSNSQATGDLGTVTVLSGQDGATYNGSGTRTDTGEGTAMMEIIHDLAPGATLFFATGFGGPANMAANIRALRDNGCQIIIDDVYYFNEPPFQDGPIAAAVNDVTGSGVLYFSSAGNAGRADAGTSTVWEGNYSYSGQHAGLAGAEEVHSFGFDVYDQAHMSNGGNSLPLYLFWADPYGHSGNDYNLFVTDAAETTIVAQSTNTQNGSQDPVETCSIFDGQRVFITKHAGSARYLQLNLVSNGQAYLQYQTPGVTRGHSSAQNAFSIAATPTNAFFPFAFNGTAQTETFSADGPRRIFFDQDGNELNPGSGFLNGGGVVRAKPDMTASDGVSTTVPGFGAFYGTSAAAPHAGAIAALVYGDSRAIPQFLVGPIMESNAIDIMNGGYDYDSGYGIVDAYAALAAIAPANDNFASGTGISGTSGSISGSNGGASVETGEPNNAGRPNGRSLWYTWTVPSTGWYHFDTIYSNYDTTLGIYTGSSVNATTLLASNDDVASGDLQSYAGFFALAGTVCHVSVDGYGGAYGNIVLQWGPIAPLNDNFANAQYIGNGNSGTVYGANSSASKESGEPAHGSNVGGDSVWYLWTAPSTGDYNFNLVGSNFDTTLGVYTGSSVSGLTAVAEDDDADGITQSSASFHAIGGTAYYIAVDGYHSSFSNTTATGVITLNWQPLQVTSLSLSPSSVPATASSTGTVTLNADASQTGGSLVALSSNTSGVSVPATVTVVNGRTATFTAATTTAAVGHTATVTASYNGTSAASTLAVTQTGTALSVADANGTSGSPVSLTATLTRTTDNAGVSGKSLTFKLSGVTVGTATTNSSGVATLTYTLPASYAVSRHTISVSYAGDSTYLSSSSSGSLYVKTNTHLTIANVSGQYGQTVTLSATLIRLIDNAGLGSKTVTFKVNGGTVGTATTNSSGVVTLSYVVSTSLSVGSHPITASFAGDTNNNPSSGSGTITAAKSNTTLTVPSLSGSIGQTVTLTATLLRATNSLPLSGKSVTFKVDSTTIGTATTNSSGVASKSYTVSSSLSTGSHTIGAAFAADTTNNASSGSGTLTVTKPGVTVTVPTVTGAYGQTVALTATLKRATDNAPLSGKSLTFKMGSTTLGTATTNSSGVATVNYTIPTSLSVGSKTITVSFAGDSGYNSGSGSGTLTVTKANVTLTVPAVSGARGATVVLSATLKRATDNAPLSGKTITFKVSGTTIGTALTNSSGVATHNYAISSSATTGAHSITVSSLADAVVNVGSGSGTLTVH